MSRRSIEQIDTIFPSFGMKIWRGTQSANGVGGPPSTPFCRPRARLYGAAWSLYRFGYNGLTIDRYQGSADMAVTQAIPMTRHPYADGSYKKMLIDGKWTDAASGKRFETHNPATGELLATVAEGDAEDINRGVAAARRAFEGPWSKVKPYERQVVLLKLGDLVERHFDELSSLD